MCECRAGRTIRYGADREAIKPEIEEMAVAAELLGTTNEAALDKVLTITIADAVRQSGGSLPAVTGRILREIVKRVLRRVLPTVGRAPMLLRGRGGHMLPPRAGRILGIELEGLSPEDMELAAARRSVRFTRSAAQRASRASRRLPPGLVARRAALGAARRWAPGILPAAPAAAAIATTHSTTPPETSPPVDQDYRQRGAWVRRGNNVFVIC
jgi:hypothetical protein